MSSDWENCKENVQPIKRGRSANMLAKKGLGEHKPKGGEEATNDQQKAAFEKMISKAKTRKLAAAAADATGNAATPTAPSADGDGKSDSDKPSLLEVYLLYFKWVRDTYPEASDRALAVLEQATCDMKDEGGIKNDPRYIKLWIEYVRIRACMHVFLHP